MLNPCARESKARTRRFLREKLISDHGMLSSYEDQEGAANGQALLGFFRDARDFRQQLDAGSRDIRMVNGYSNLLYVVLKLA